MVKAGGQVGTFYRNESALNCEIFDQARGKFDEAALGTKLKGEIEKQIRASGARISGGGESGPSFNCEYRTGDILGVIEVVVVPMGPSGYRLTSIIHETRR